MLKRGIWIIVTLFGSACFAQNNYPNPYAMDSDWLKLPPDREMGATSAIYPTNDGQHIWVVDRCGGGSCSSSDYDPVMLFDLNGNLVRSFGKGMFSWPHGVTVDAEDNVWVTDATGLFPVIKNLGHVIYKFSPDGKLLMVLGRRGQGGNDEELLRRPSDVVVAPSGDIFVADGHGALLDWRRNNRIVKFSAEGKFIKSWGVKGEKEGQLFDPHALAMDSQGRLFVADRGNSRIQIFDQEGELLHVWKQFGRPSGLYIDSNDTLYVADSESNESRNPGWQRGIRIGSAVTGEVTAFMPDTSEDNPDRSPTSGAEGVAVDANGVVYGAEVNTKSVKRYQLK